MRNFRLMILSAVASAAMTLTPAHAATVEVELDLDLAYKSANGVGAVTRTAITDLVGAKFTATYTDGSSEDWEWVQFNQWRAGTDHVSDDMTIDYSWRGWTMDATKRVQSFEMNLVDASMIFDAGAYPDSDPRNSPTTLIGKPFDITAGLEDVDGAVVASYSERVQIGQHTTGEDSFTNLFVDFSGLEDGGFLGAITWVGDTDVLDVAGDLTSVVPLPAGFLLLLTGFGSLGLLRRRRTGAISAV